MDSSTMSAETSSFPFLHSSGSVPAHCTPTNSFLRWYSSIFHTCVPTPLAFFSVLFGCLSVLSWLFAQLPQIIKNQRLRSTSGLSIFFLVEWCLGDMSNLGGALLTDQATWQIVVAAYYCSVDLVLVGQWSWFEGLGKGKRSKGDGNNNIAVYEVDPGAPPAMCAVANKQSPPPTYGTIYQDGGEISTSSPAQIIRTMPPRPSQPLPSPSPRTFLLITMIIALHGIGVQASPVTTNPHGFTTSSSETPSLGTILSWSSTVLYLLSRLPQLIKNQRRRSTAGLSPLLFLAAFMGNFFYSSSLLLNPCLWYNFGPFGGGGWVGLEGNERADWAKRALPFFLGAAGVLIMDAAVGVQFWVWGGNEQAEAKELHAVDQVVGSPHEPTGPAAQTGWLRGWYPSPSFSPIDSLRRFSPRILAWDRDTKTDEQQTPLTSESQ